MRTLVVLLGFVTALASAAMAQGNTIREVIAAQIDAFRQNDVATAFTYASPTIQQLFVTPENFGNMVRSGYPMVWRPADVAFLRQQTRNGVTYQEMRFVDANGGEHAFVYEMVQVDGAWRINGVFPVKPADPSV